MYLQKCRKRKAVHHTNGQNILYSAKKDTFFRKIFFLFISCFCNLCKIQVGRFYGLHHCTSWKNTFYGMLVSARKYCYVIRMFTNTYLLRHGDQVQKKCFKPILKYYVAYIEKLEVLIQRFFNKIESQYINKMQRQYILQVS